MTLNSLLDFLTSFPNPQIQNELGREEDQALEAVLAVDESGESESERNQAAVIGQDNYLHPEL